MKNTETNHTDRPGDISGQQAGASERPNCSSGQEDSAPSQPGAAYSYMGIFAVVMFAGLGSAIFHPEGGRMANCVAGAQKGRSMGIFAASGNLGFVFAPF